MSTLFLLAAAIKVVLAVVIALGLAWFVRRAGGSQAEEQVRLAAVLSGALALLMVAAIPFGDPVPIAGQAVPLVVADLTWSFLLVLGLLFLGVLATPAEPRAAGCRLAMILAASMALLLGGKTDLPGIVEAQRSWWNLFQVPVGPLALALFWTAILAQAHLGADPRRAAALPSTWAEQTAWAAWSLLAVALFLGGHTLFGLERASGIPALDALLGVLFLLGKALLLLWVVIQLARALPLRPRERLAAYGWAVLPPLAFCALLLGGGMVLLRIL